MDDSGQGKGGITVEDCMMMPEFTACPFAPDVIQYYKDSTTKKIHPRQFMKICTILCRRTPALKKKECNHVLLSEVSVEINSLKLHNFFCKVYTLSL